MTRSADPFRDLLAANAEYVKTFNLGHLEAFAARGLAVVTCFDSRIEPLQMMGLQPGDAKILRVAGGRINDDERVRIAEPDILGRMHVEPAHDEARRLAGLDHDGEPVQGGVRVGATNRLDERRDDVIMPVARLIIFDRFLLNRFFGDTERDVDFAVHLGRRQRQDQQEVDRRLRHRVPAALFRDRHARRRAHGENARIDEPVMHDEIGGAQQFGGAKRQQPGITGASADEIYVSLSHARHVGV